MITDNTEIRENDYKIVELINKMSAFPDQYKNIQVFLRREINEPTQYDCEYLMVTSTSFGKTKIINLNVINDEIVISFLDCTTQRIGNVNLNINDKHQKVLFISWNDVKEMVLSEDNM